LSSEVDFSINNLSEVNFKEVCELFNNEGIYYQTQIDQKTEDSNKLSVKNNLRYLASPSISLNLLEILIRSEDIKSFSEGTLTTLANMDIYLQDGASVDFNHNDMDEYQKPVVFRILRLILTLLSISVIVYFVYTVIVLNMRIE
jgi:hypothetical protein